MADDNKDYQQTRSSNRTATGRMRGQGRPSMPLARPDQFLVIPPQTQMQDRVVGIPPQRYSDPGMVRMGPSPIIPGPAEDMHHYMFRQLVPGFRDDWGANRPFSMYDPQLTRRTTEPYNPSGGDVPLRGQPYYMVPPRPAQLMPMRPPLRDPFVGGPSLQDLFRSQYGE